MPASITVTDRDYDQLSTLIQAAASSTSGRPVLLELELERARIVPVGKVPPDVVTMNSTVTYEDLNTHQRRTVTLVYPKDANIDEGRISVLTPMGNALIGLRVGETIDWALRDNSHHRLRVLSLDHQPEAAGEA